MKWVHLAKEYNWTNPIISLLMVYYFKDSLPLFSILLAITMALSMTTFWIEICHAEYPTHPSKAALTSLIGSDVDSHMLGRIGTLVADAVDGLDLEGVDRVGQQVADEDAGLGQAHLPR